VSLPIRNVDRLEIRLFEAPVPQHGLDFTNVLAVGLDPEQARFSGAVPEKGARSETVIEHTARAQFHTGS